MRDDWRRIDAIARLCPTPHNTQPFRLLERDDEAVDILCLRERMLPEEDHGNLYVMAAFGSFALALERAGRQVGRLVEVLPEPGIDPASINAQGARVLLGRARLTETVAPESDNLLETRRTSRLPYYDKEVPRDAIDDLMRVARTHGHELRTYDDPGLLADFLKMNVDAIIDNLQLDDEREEIKQWYRLGQTPEFGDGLWRVPMNQSAWEFRLAFGLPWLTKLPIVRQFATYRYLQTQRGTRHIALLRGPFSSWKELNVGGRLLLELWLEMARHDIYMQPFGSTLTNPVYAQRVAEQFGVEDTWLIFRFGYSDTPPRAPRLQSLLLDEPARETR